MENLVAKELGEKSGKSDNIFIADTIAKIRTFIFLQLVHY